MPNVEQLGLYLSVAVTNAFIDRNSLKKSILNRLLRLNQLTFYIRSVTLFENEMNLLLTENIQGTIDGFPCNEIISYVDYFPESKQCQCQIYSYPFLMPYYNDITNKFPGGLFNYVRVVSLFDEYPFEHEFFLQIQKLFPFMEELALINRKSQNDKHFNGSNNDNGNFSIIKYCFLSELYLVDVHDDYIEQFLFDTKTDFQNNLVLYIRYESLQRITHHFTRDTTRRNCAKITKLHFCDEAKCSTSLQEFFPNAKICFPSIH